MNLVTEIQKQLLVERKESHQKNSFWPTDSEKDTFEIYAEWKGLPRSNPMTPHTKFGLEVRTMVEKRVIDSFKRIGILVEPKDGDQHRVEIEWNGIKVTGYMDGLLNIEGEQIPIEIKTSFGDYQKKDLENCNPKTSYLKQLAFYMASIKAKKEILFYVHFKDAFIIDRIYQFEMTREGTKFKCYGIEFDLMDTMNRYKDIYDNYIVKDIEPASDFKYKYDIETLDWKAVPKSKIANARANRAVYGDWQIQYSSWKDYLIKKEGTTIGYTEEELKRIHELTAGYTSKK